MFGFRNLLWNIPFCVNKEISKSKVLPEQFFVWSKHDFQKFVESSAPIKTFGPFQIFWNSASILKYLAKRVFQIIVHVLQKFNKGGFLKIVFQKWVHEYLSSKKLLQSASQIDKVLILKFKNNLKWILVQVKTNSSCFPILQKKFSFWNKHYFKCLAFKKNVD
jgi:hypothetical protein